MAGLYRTKDRKGKPHPRWRFWYFDWQRRRRHGTGTSRRRETLAIAFRIEEEHRRIFLGYQPPPCESDKPLIFNDIAEQYHSWGNSQGGRSGRPWSAAHARLRRRSLQWWKEHLGLERMPDLVGSLPRVEEELRTLQAAGRAGRTLQSYAESLKSFCNWCVTRAYLEKSPLMGLAHFDMTPKSVRRAMTQEEIHRLIEVAPLERKLLYATAMCTGLRVRELRSLDLADIDPEGSGLHLRPAWTKNRKPGYQPVPRELMNQLMAFAQSGIARQRYEEASRFRKDSKSAEELGVPEHPLFFVPVHTSRTIARDLAAAGIPKCTSEGKLDFHALRVAYTTFLIEVGASIKEAQTLARHSNPRLTMNIYARTRVERLHDLAESVGEAVGVASECRIHTERASPEAKDDDPEGDLGSSFEE